MQSLLMYLSLFVYATKICAAIPRSIANFAPFAIQYTFSSSEYKTTFRQTQRV